MTLEEGHFRTFMLVPEENFKSEVCNDDSAVQKARCILAFGGRRRLKKKNNLIMSVSPLPSKALIKERVRGTESLCPVCEVTWRYPILKCCCKRLGLKIFWSLGKMTRSDQIEVLE